jgi:hypothetical protein
MNCLNKSNDYILMEKEEKKEKVSDFRYTQTDQSNRPYKNRVQDETLLIYSTRKSCLPICL